MRADVANVKNAALSVLDLLRRHRSSGSGSSRCPYGTAGQHRHHSVRGLRRQPDGRARQPDAHRPPIQLYPTRDGRPNPGEQRGGSSQNYKNADDTSSTPGSDLVHGDQLPHAGRTTGSTRTRRRPAGERQREPHEPRRSARRRPRDARRPGTTHRPRRHLLHDGRSGEPAEHHVSPASTSTTRRRSRRPRVRRSSRSGTASTARTSARTHPVPSAARLGTTNLALAATQPTDRQLAGHVQPLGEQGQRQLLLHSRGGRPRARVPSGGRGRHRDRAPDRLTRATPASLTLS